MMITPETRLCDIYNLPEFDFFCDFLFPDMNMSRSSEPVSVLGSIWQVKPIVDALNDMLCRVRDGKKLFYPISGVMDAEGRPDRRYRGLFHFSAGQDGKKRKLVMICPGGGYRTVCSVSEGFPIAKRLNELGYEAFVLRYRTDAEAAAPAPQDDLAEALRYVLSHAEEFSVDPSGYAVCGFSAGGHLVASFGTENIGWKKYGLPCPGAVFLAYPVITMEDFTHPDSRRALLGNPDQETIRNYSAEQNVTCSYPPCYLWQCERDNVVPIQNSISMAEALGNACVPYIYKTYDSEVHGWGIGYKTPAEGWLDEAVAFWMSQLHV